MKLPCIICAVVISIQFSITSSDEFRETNKFLQSKMENSNTIGDHSSEEKKEEEFRGRKELLQRRVQRGNKEDEDDRKLVTVDLSALRPSLPGLVLFKYGDQAPKLVQVDIATLNPLIQPHVIWPQFHQQIDTLEELPLDSLEQDEIESIPYLGKDKSLAPKQQQQQRMAKMTAAEQPMDWPDLDDIADSDIYDFIPNSFRNEELMTLQDSLPLAEEIIVPLDWEEDRNTQHHGTGDYFVTHEWKPGDLLRNSKHSPVQRESSRHHNSIHENIHYTSLHGYSGWQPTRKKNATPAAFHPHRRHPGVESEALEHPKKLGLGKKNMFFTKGWGPGGRPLTELEAKPPGHTQEYAPTEHENRQNKDENKVSRQDSWSVPRQHWNIPQLFGLHW